jgi:predicted oxidoreductase
MSAYAPRGVMHNGLCPELIRAIATEIWVIEIPAKLVTVVGSEAKKARKSTPQCCCHEMSKKYYYCKVTGTRQNLVP